MDSFWRGRGDLGFSFSLITCIANTESSWVPSPCLSSIPSVTGSPCWTGPCFTHQPERMQFTAPRSLPSAQKSSCGSCTPEESLQTHQQWDRGFSALIYKVMAEQGTQGMVIFTYPRYSCNLSAISGQATQNRLQDESQQIAAHKLLLNRPSRADPGHRMPLLSLPVNCQRRSFECGLCTECSSVGACPPPHDPIPTATVGTGAVCSRLYKIG